ncbi:MAG: DUF2169 domain-containing protein [Byssovorax sp.]
MQTVILCPFSAGTLTWQGQDGAWTLTVVVKGTFSLVHGQEAVLADYQAPVEADQHYDNDARSSLYCASELVPYKPRTDVVLVGSAFAPERVAVEALIARLCVGEIDKAIGVIGDRVWVEGPEGLEPSAPRPFQSMPLRYERAARAPDNPRGFDLARPPVLGALALPNLEALDDSPGGQQTLGFGPVAPTAQPRRALLDQSRLHWVASGQAGPLPQGFDFGFYNVAPREQQIGLLRNGATILLENLHREHPRLMAKVPAVRPRAFLVSGDAERAAEVALRCDTLWIDTDRALLTLTWRGVIGLMTAETADLQTLVVAAESKGRELRYKHIQRMLREGSSSLDTSDLFGDTAKIGARLDAARALGLVSENTSDASTQRKVAPSSDAPTRSDHAIDAAKLLGVESNSGLRQSLQWEELSSDDLVEATRTGISSPAINIQMPRDGEFDGDDTMSETTRGGFRRR